MISPCRWKIGDHEWNNIQCDDQRDFLCRRLEPVLTAALIVMVLCSFGLLVLGFILVRVKWRVSKLKAKRDALLPTFRPTLRPNVQASDSPTISELDNPSPRTQLMLDDDEDLQSPAFTLEGQGERKEENVTSTPASFQGDISPAFSL